MIGRSSLEKETERQEMSRSVGFSWLMIRVFKEMFSFLKVKRKKKYGDKLQSVQTRLLEHLWL